MTPDPRDPLEVPAARDTQRPARTPTPGAAAAAAAASRRAALPPALERPPHTVSLTLVLPAYNEEECIGEAIAQSCEYLDRGFLQWQLVVVDDGSTDRTGDIVRAAAQADPRVQCVTHSPNRGYGAAIASGFAAARCELVAYTDSDLQFDVRELGHVVQTMLEQRADAVFGYRVYRYDTVLRCLLSWTYNRLVRVLFGVRVRDVDCAFKVFRRPVTEALQLRSTDFFVDTEMVARTARLGLRSIEIGVRHYPRLAGRTTVRPSDIPRTLRTVARMWWRIRRDGR
jgi:glycosyltransferase involved in cell wall biosynthesis